MIDSIYIMLYMVGFLSFVLAVETKTITYAGVSLTLYLICWVQAIYIEVPWIAVTNATNYTTGNQQHLDSATSASCWIFIIFDILILLYHFLGFWRKRRGEEPAMP